MRIAVAACLCFGTVSAQEQLRVRPAEVQQEDVVAALGALGVDVLRFDFSDFTRENYDVAVYLDEADSTGTERLYTVHAGGTRQQLTRMSEEVRMGFRKELHLPETTTEYVRGRSLTLIFSQKNDSTKLLTVHIPGMMRFSLPLELRDSGAGGEPRYFYSLRPFKLSAVEAGRWASMCCASISAISHVRTTMWPSISTRRTAREPNGCIPCMQAIRRSC